MKRTMTVTMRFALVALALLEMSRVVHAAQSFSAANTVGESANVTVELEVSGDLLEKANQETKKIPLTGHFDLAYEEENVASAAEGTLASLRRYSKADVAWKIGDDKVTHSLPEAERLLACQFDGRDALLFSPTTPLLRDDLESVDVIGNSLLLNRLLPKGEVAKGDTWKPDDGALAALMCVDKLTSNEVVCELKETTETVARFEINGRMTALVNDVTTQIEIKGRFRYDLRAKRVDWLGLLMQERREISAVARGFDVVGRLQVRIVPRAAAEIITAADREDAHAADPKAAKVLRYEPDDHAWQLTHDHDWYLNRDRRDMAVFRLIRQGEFIAQCKLWPLPQRAPEKLPTLAEFQENVQQALGESFASFLEAGEFPEGDNYRVFRVVASGRADDIPMLWYYYLVADASGRQAAFAFTVEDKRVEAFGAADREMLAGFRFLGDGAEGLKSPTPAASGGAQKDAEK